MSGKVRNVLVTILTVALVIILAWLAWTLAGVIIKVVLSVGIFLVLAGFVAYIYNQMRRR